MNPSVIQKDVITADLETFEVDLLDFFKCISVSKYPKPDVGFNDQPIIVKMTETINLSMNDSFDETALLASRLNDPASDKMNHTISIDNNNPTGSRSTNRRLPNFEGSKIMGEINARTMTINESEFSKDHVMVRDEERHKRKYTGKKNFRGNANKKKRGYSNMNSSIHKITKSRHGSRDNNDLNLDMTNISNLREDSLDMSIDKEKSILEFKNQTTQRRIKTKRKSQIRTKSIDESMGIDFYGSRGDITKIVDEDDISGLSTISHQNFFLACTYINKRQNEFLISTNNKLILLDISDMNNIYIKMNVKIKNMVVR